MRALKFAPTLAIASHALSVNEDGTVALGIGETPFDPRDTVSVIISGVPGDATLSAGTNNHNGTWTLTPAQLASLSLTAGEVTSANDGPDRPKAFVICLPENRETTTLPE